MDCPNYTWKADAEEEAIERQLAALKIKCAEQRRKQREMELMKSNIFYPFPTSSTSQSTIPKPSTSTLPETLKPPEKSFSCGGPMKRISNSSLMRASNNKCQAKFRYDIDEMKYIASKMQLSVLLNKEKRTPIPGPAAYQRNIPSTPIRKNGLYRCVPGLEKPEPLNDVLNKLVPPPTRRFRMIRKTSNIRPVLMEEEEELENVYHQEEP